VALALASSPAVVSGSGTTVTTASYTPTANSLLVALVAVGNPPGTATATTGAVTDSLGSTWTMKRRQNGTSGVGSAEVWMLDIGASPAARTITLTGSKSGVLLAVLCVTGAQPVASQTGATAVSASTTANTISITPTATGSYIVGVAAETVVDYAVVAAASTTLIGSLDDVNNGGAYGAWRSTNTTTVASAQTYGVTPAPANETEKVAVEVLAAAGAPALTASAALTGSGTLTATATQGGATYRMYAAASPPTTAAADSAAISVGMEFYVTSTASLTAIHWWQPTTSASTATREGALYLVSTQGQVAVATSAAPSGTGWQTLSFSSPVALTANTRYRAVVLHPGGQYTAQQNYYGSGVDETNGPLVVPKAANVTDGVQGSYTYGGSLAYASNLFNTTNYGVDVTVATSGGAALTAPAGLSGSGALSATTTPKVTTPAALTGSGALSATATQGSGGGGSAATRIWRILHLNGPEYGAPQTQATNTFSNSNVGVYDTAYHYDTQTTLNYIRARGWDAVKVPIRWERIQRTLNGALDTTELGRLTAFIGRCATAGLNVIVDIHNYGLYYLFNGTNGTRTAIGSANVPVSAYSDLWSRLATALNSYSNVLGYAIMAEPQNLGGLTKATWQTASQAAVTAIRAVDTTRIIYVAGWDWSITQGWVSTNGNPWITDATGLIRYEGHHYWDSDTSGTYPNSYATEVANAITAGYTAGANPDALYTRIFAEIDAFRSWCTTNNVKGIIGEWGWPNNADTTAWAALGEAYLQRLDSYRIDHAVWSAGEWQNDNLSVYKSTTTTQPLSIAQPQAPTLEAHPSFNTGLSATVSAAFTGSGTLAAATGLLAPTQTHFRGRNDDGTQVTATWKAATDTSWAQATGAPFRVRFVVQAPAGTVSDWQLMYSLNGGAWTPVTSTSTPVQSVLSANAAENDATTQQISTGQFYPGTFTENDGFWGSTTFTADGVTELEASVQIVPTGSASGDVVRLKVATGSWADLTGGYSQTPAITVVVPGVAAAPLTGSGALSATTRAGLRATAALTGSGSLLVTPRYVVTAPTQTGFRGRNDDGGEAAATWRGPLNASWTQPANTPFRARFQVSAPVGASSDWQLMYSYNGGAWTPVTGTSTPAQSVLSPNLGENDPTTQQLGGGAPFYAGSVSEVDGFWGTTTFTQAGVTELEAVLQLVSVNDGDTVRLRVATGAWADLTGGYLFVPTITVGTPGGPVAAPLRGAGALAAAVGRVPTHSDDFESYPIGTWADGSIHGQWFQEWSGVGTVQILSTGTSKAIQLESAINPSQNTGWGDTASSLITSEPNRFGDIDFTIDMRTLVQLRTLRTPPTTPNAWEVAWIGWNYKRLSATTLRFYYVAVKPGTPGAAGTGFELGKVDQSIALAGGQRFFVTDSSTSYPIGTTWHTIRVRQIGARIQVWVDGDLKADFTDGPGSAGFPAWGATAGETVLTDGGIALYQEDSRVQFDNLAISGETSPGVPPTSTGASYRMYAGATPPNAAFLDSAMNAGVEFYVTSAANVTEIRWWQGTSNTNTATREAGIFTVTTGTLVATATAAAPSGTGWQTLTIPGGFALAANTRYRAVVYHPSGGYVATSLYFTSGADETNGPLVIPTAVNASTPGQGTFDNVTGLAYPHSTFNSTNYWTDVTVVATGGTAFTASAGFTGSGALTATPAPAPATEAGFGETAFGTSPFGVPTGGGAPFGVSPFGTSPFGAAAVSPPPGVAVPAALTGSGSLTATTSAFMPGAASANLTGAGTLAATRVVKVTRSAALSGAGTLSAVGVPGAAARLPAASLYLAINGSWVKATSVQRL
jgi:endoglucanase